MDESSLFHHFNIDFLHVNLGIEFWREFRLLQQLHIHVGLHGGQQCCSQELLLSWIVDGCCLITQADT